MKKITTNMIKYIEEKRKKGLYGWDGIVVHPGYTLSDEIEFWGFTKAEVAARTGYTVQTISRIVNAKESIIPDMALKLERVFSGRPSADFWLGLQSSYDKYLAKVREEKKR